MKKLILSVLLLISTVSFAGKIDSLFQRHQISFSIGNGMSQEFFNGPFGTTLSDVHYNGVLLLYGPNGTSTYNSGSLGNWLPNYGLSLQLKYSCGLSKHVRLETGLGYLMEGFIINQANVDSNLQEYKYKGYLYIHMITIPVHFKFIKEIGKGAFTCTIGPDFILPVYSLYKQTDLTLYGIPQPNATTRHRYDMNSTAYYSNVGFDLKMGYEKKISSAISVDIGPAISFTNLLLMDKNLRNYYTELQSRPYQYYVGLDVAFIFDAKKKK